MSRYNLTKITHQVSLDYANKFGLPPNLVGMCAISSFSLYLAMIKWDRIYGTTYLPSLVIGASKRVEERKWIHCWVESGKYVFDPTFIQFDSNYPFFIGYKTPQHNFLSSSLKIAKSFDDFVTWEDWQMPNSKNTNWFLKRMEFYATQPKRSIHKQNQLRDSSNQYTVSSRKKWM